MIDILVNTNPFPGLRPFLEEENYLFFGREAQVDTLISKLSTHKFLAVVGTSGSGKSSLVNCGLFPALHGGYMSRAGSRWRIAKFRPGNDPMREMAWALAQKHVLFEKEMIGNLPLASVILTNLQRSKLGLIETYRQARLSSDDNLLVVVDQFEELFRFSKLRNDYQENQTDQLNSATAFVNLLLEAAAQSEVPIYIVITMRSDFLGDCSTLRGLPEAINGGQYLVSRMKREERKSAILGPVEVMGAHMTERLLMRLVNDVGDNPDQLSILQHALNRTWAEWTKTSDHDQPIDLEHYQKIGTMVASLDQHANQAYQELETDRAKNICGLMFKALTEVGSHNRGIRRPTKLGMLCEIIEASEKEVIEVIETFRKPSRSFLMPPADRKLDQDTIIDISHESFMRIWKRLIRWTEEEQESVRTYQRLSDASTLYKEGKSSLLSDPYLQFALNWKKTQQPNVAWARRYDENFEETMGFLNKSKVHWLKVEEEKKAKLIAEQQVREEKQKRKTSRARSLAAVVGVAALVSIAFMVYAFDKRSEAEHLQLTADSLLVLSEAQNITLQNQKEQLDSIASAARKEKELLAKLYNSKVEGENNQASINQAASALTEVVVKEKERTSDTDLLREYEPIIRDYSGSLKADTLINVTEKIDILRKFDELMEMNKSDTLTVKQKLSQWRYFISYPRNTAQVDTAKVKIDSLQQLIQNHAVILSEDNFLTAHDIVPPMPVDTASIFSLGNIYMWARVNAPKPETLTVEWYSKRRLIFKDTVGVETNTMPGYRVWNLQKFDRQFFTGEKNEVRLYNEKGDLIGRKKFEIVP
ncbi:MAG: hypothetical protein RIG62_17690 [Cyclobacteriaceae bacterium]